MVYQGFLWFSVVFVWILAGVSRVFCGDLWCLYGFSSFLMFSVVFQEFSMVSRGLSSESMRVIPQKTSGKTIGPIQSPCNLHLKVAGLDDAKCILPIAP